MYVRWASSLVLARTEKADADPTSSEVSRASPWADDRQTRRAKGMDRMQEFIHGPGLMAERGSREAAARARMPPRCMQRKIAANASHPLEDQTEATPKARPGATTDSTAVRHGPYLLPWSVPRSWDDRKSVQAERRRAFSGRQTKKSADIGALSRESL